MIDLFPLLRPFIFLLDPEVAHNLTVKGLKAGLSPTFFRSSDDPVLKTSVFGLDFTNPVGLAAGFDKNAEVMDAMLAQGFGFVEAGTVTPLPQDGNARPRLFRLKEDRAVINRFGFNNAGLEAFAKNLTTQKGRSGIVGANVGANKDAADRTEDYVTGIKRLNGLASYFTVNISSPNTPGLRALQSRDALEDLLTKVIKARNEGPATPILLKIAPDLSDEDKKDIAAVALEVGIDGLIISNTTIARPNSLKNPHKDEAGGLSGAPLMTSSTKTLSDIYRLTDGKIPLVGVGGIASGADAYAKIRAGASLVQFYSMLVYGGTGLVAKIKRELADCIKSDGFSSVDQAVGADHK